MSIAKAIQQWSDGIPLWQQDALGRLFANGELESADYADLYALLKSGHGIPDAAGRVPKKFTADQVPSAVEGVQSVRLLAIKDLQNVNALALNQVIDIGAEGLTVIYGANGSGKSGYTRALKRACRARDQRETILPDAKLPPNSSAKPRASFVLSIDGHISDVTWIEESVPPAELSSISIFDARCARAYIDEQDDFSYVPYGLDLLEGLASACRKLKTQLDYELGQINTNVVPFASLFAASTKVGKVLDSLTAKTDKKLIDSLVTLTAEEVSRHAALSKGLKEPNPKDTAALLTLRRGRFLKLSERCAKSVDNVRSESAEALRALVDAARASRAAADDAAKLFKSTAGQLPGTGGEPWQELFNAARKFCVESHPHDHFPNLPSGALCPLCQQPLGAASARLIAFDDFIRGEAEALARTRRDAAKQAYKTFFESDLSIGYDAELKAELAALDKSLSERCAVLQASLDERRENIKAACQEGGDWDSVVSITDNPCSELVALVERLAIEIAALEEASDEAARALLISEFGELDARVRLGPLKGSVLDVIDKLLLKSKLLACQGSVKTTNISLKSSDLVDKVVSKGLAEALNEEFGALQVGHLHVAVKSQSVKGKTYHKLAIELPGAVAPRDILSEGEQRAVAIASFLAEINLGVDSSCIVFDDPVSSLDHRRRELVATRFVQEAAKRQVVLFTHDLYFLSLLQLAAQASGVPMIAMSIRRAAVGFGVKSENLPFEGATTKLRIGMLKQLQVQCASLHKANEEEAFEERARSAYGRLRDAWERAVEEVLLNGVVWRFKAGVSTQSLREVAVDDTDYAAIALSMTQCSKYAHDGSGNAIVPVPSPDVLAKDIAALESWRDIVIARRETLKAQRPK